MSIARTRPEEPIDREGASAAISDVFDNARQFAIAVGWKHQPAFDGLCEAVEGDIKCLLRHETVVYFFEFCIQRKCACCVERGFPECIKVRGFIPFGTIGLKFFE